MQDTCYIHTVEVHNTVAAEHILPSVFNLINPSKVIDIGCGTGSWLKVAKKLGATQVLGLDGVQVDKTLLEIEENEFQKHNLTSPFASNEKFDLAICLEVAEHLPESAADTLVDTLADASNSILFSAALPEQGGQNHINEQWPEYWQHKFAAKGLYPLDIIRVKHWSNDGVEWWYRQNMVLYTTRNLAEKLNMVPNEPFQTYIHPDLFKLKTKNLREALAEIERIKLEYENILKRSQHPTIIQALKALMKAFIKMR